MSTRYLRLAERPNLVCRRYTECGACGVEASYKQGDWMCPSCGTVWPGDVFTDDGSNATMYHEWSGEQLTGPVIPNAAAWRFARREC